MKYYKVIDKSLDLEQKSKGLVADIPSANGKFVPNGKKYFDRMGSYGNREIIEDAPVFDYFYLQSYGEKKDWEWRLQDVHGFMGEYPTGGYWYLSDKCKKIFEQFFIAPKYHFYETRLLYKGEKLVYWIFQFPVEPYKNIDFQVSDFILKDDKTIYHFASNEEYLTFYRKEYRETKRELFCTKLSLIQNFDLVYSSHNEKIVSDRLKTAIEENNIIGFEFSELHYEIIVP
jgi:hypothetical protein